jgi:hypothetical protein
MEFMMTMTSPAGHTTGPTNLKAAQKATHRATIRV